MATSLNTPLPAASAAAPSASQLRLGALVRALRQAPPVSRDMVVVEYDKRDGQLWALDQQSNQVFGPLGVGGGGGTPYVLPVATDTRLGGIRKGPGFEVIGSGVLEHDVRSLPILP